VNAERSPRASRASEASSDSSGNAVMLVRAGPCTSTRPGKLR
jgi:hypothetical protein